MQVTDCFFKELERAGYGHKAEDKSQMILFFLFWKLVGPTYIILNQSGTVIPQQWHLSCQTTSRETQEELQRFNTWTLKPKTENPELEIQLSGEHKTAKSYFQ